MWLKRDLVTPPSIVSVVAVTHEAVSLSRYTPFRDIGRLTKPRPSRLAQKRRDLESILWGLRRRQWLFGVRLFLTLVPLKVRDGLWYAAFDWSLAAVPWFLYFARLRRRTTSLVCAISFTLIPIPLVLHSLVAGGPAAEFAIVWMVVAFIWLAYFRQRSC